MELCAEIVRKIVLLLPKLFHWQCVSGDSQLLRLLSTILLFKDNQIENLKKTYSLSKYNSNTSLIPTPLSHVNFINSNLQIKLPLLNLQM